MEKNVSETCWMLLKDVLTRTVQLDDTSWKRLGDIFARRLEDVFKTSWRRLEDVLKTFLQDVLMFWRSLGKTSWRRLHQEKCLLGSYHNYNHNFTWSWPNSQEIVTFVPIMGPWWPKLNWNKIHIFLWIRSTSSKLMISYVF